MKISSLLVIPALFLVSLGTSFAVVQPIEISEVSIKGTLYSQDQIAFLVNAQPNLAPAPMTDKTPLTIKSLLTIFGHADVPAKNARFFLKGTSLVLADQSGTSTYGTLYSPGESSTLFNNQTAIEAADATFLSSLLSGEIFSTEKQITAKKVRAKVTFTAHGTSAGVAYVLRGSLVYTVAQPAL